MKMRKFTALLAVLTLLCTLWAPVAVSAETPAPVTAPAAPAAPAAVAAVTLEAPLELLAALDNGDKLCAVYNQIIDGIRKGETYFAFEGGYTLTEQEQAILQSVVDATLPESYGDFVGHSYCSVYADRFYVGFYDWGITTEQNAQMEQRVAELTADLAGKSDYEKSLILYERLINANVYDYSEHHQTAYSALIEGASVCAGYARAYQVLLQAVGIPCLYVTGTADNGFEIGGHAWNLVKLDGYWYYCDPTWDDHDSLWFGIDYTYFNISYDTISADHFLNDAPETWVPKETAPAADYYTRLGLAVESLTVEQMIALFKQYNPLPLRILGDRATNARLIIDTFYANLHTIADALGVSLNSTDYSIRGDHEILTLSLVLDHEHEYRYETTQPTCEQYGETAYVCRTCGDKGWIGLDPLGHNATDAWSCDENGHYKACTRCDGALEYSEHTYAGGACSVCGYVNHVCAQNAVWVVCDEVYHMQQCTICNTELLRESHTYDGGTCTFCGHAHDHDYIVTSLTEPTCETPGRCSYTCQSCGDVYSEIIPCQGHQATWVACDDTYHIRQCTVCHAELLWGYHTYDDDADADCNDCGYQRQITLYGDANGDGKINNKDLGRLQQYLNGWEIDIDASACDLNGDGKVNNKDLGRLQQYLNGWDVTLG